jgi:ABC-type Fe3+-hydroxamate transport system substrate-binding protein
MKILATIAVCIALSLAYVGTRAAGEQTQAGASASTQPAPARGDELHFVSVLTFHGEIVAVDPARRLVTLKGPNGEVLTLEAEKEEDLTALKDGMIGAEPGGPSGKHRAVAASVERVDAANQEITLKGPDGSLETIMVSNPESLSNFKVGDRVVITRPQALALSLEKEG